jgi:hypothetical protein
MIGDCTIIAIAILKTRRTLGGFRSGAIHLTSIANGVLLQVPCAQDLVRVKTNLCSTSLSTEKA